MSGRRVVGLDGTREGWIAVDADGDGIRAVALFRSFDEALRSYADAAVLAVDIPLGLLAEGPREADAAARRFLVERRASVFPTAPRPAYRAASYAAACAAASAAWGRKLSRQAWNLRDKILEVDRAAATDARVREVHPEVSFRLLGGPVAAPRWSKKTWGGVAERLALLEGVGLRPPPPGGDDVARAAPDDVLDAAVCAWSARRIAEGRARSFPERPAQRDPESGRLIRIEG